MNLGPQLAKIRVDKEKLILAQNAWKMPLESIKIGLRHVPTRSKWHLEPKFHEARTFGDFRKHGQTDKPTRFMFYKYRLYFSSSSLSTIPFFLVFLVCCSLSTHFRIIITTYSDTNVENMWNKKSNFERLAKHGIYLWIVSIRQIECFNDNLKISLHEGK